MRIYSVSYTCYVHKYTRIYAHISIRGKLSGARAREGSGNEKLHYFLMYLLIDQSRKGSAPPTPRPPLPSVNQSRNNLMIGAPCPFFVPSASFAPGIIMTPRFGKFFSFSHARFFSFSFGLPKARCLGDEKGEGRARYGTREKRAFAESTENSRSTG